MIEQEPTIDNNQIALERIEDYFTGIKKQLAFRSEGTAAISNDLFATYSDNPETALTKVIEGIAAGTSKIGQVSEEELSHHREIISDKLDSMMAEIREETAECFKNYFKYRYYIPVPGRSAVEGKKFQVTNSVKHFLQDDRKMFEIAALSQFVGTALLGVEMRNLYQLNEENLSFLKPLVTQLTDELMKLVEENEKDKRA